MGERLFATRPMARSDTRFGAPRRRGVLLAGLLVLGLVFGSAPASGQTGEGELDGESETEELPAIDLELPESTDDLDLGPAAPPPKELPSGDLANVSLSELIPNPEFIHPDLPAGIVVDPSTLGPIARDLNQARLDAVDGRMRLLQARSDQSLLSYRVGAIDRLLGPALAERQDSARLRTAATSEFSDFAVASFVNSEQLGSLTLSPDLDSMSVLTISDQTEEYLSATMFDAVARESVAESELSELKADRTSTRAKLSTAVAAEATALADIDDAETRVAQLAPEFESSLIQLQVRGTDLPLVVLDAYYRAAENFRVNRPACRVSWHQLAGIGRVESGHGTFGGNVVQRDGRTDGEILGPVLDGDPWLAIPDTDGGKHDLDTVWDRAVGPMQFIPGSWAAHGQDGNGDGEIDPHNLYDAALAAASHLCASSGGLDQPANYQRALLGYNRSVEYGILVMGYADEYLEALQLGPNY